MWQSIPQGKSSFTVEEGAAEGVVIVEGYPMRLSVSFLLLISILAGGCHRSGGRAQPARTADVSKTVRVPGGSSSASREGDSKTVRAPARPAHEPKKGQGEGVSRDFKAVHKPKGAGAEKVLESRHAPAPTEPPPQTASLPRKDSRAKPEGHVGATGKSSGQSTQPKRRPVPVHPAEGVGNSNENEPRHPVAAASEPSALHPGAPGALPEVAPPTRSEIPVATVPPAEQSPAKPAEEPVGTVETKASATVQPTAPSSEESAERGAKTAGVKPETPEPVEKPKGEENTAPAEVSEEKPLAAGAGKLAGAVKPGGPGGGPASKGKLSAADKKKQTEAQKREETQKAAEQSYEAGLQFLRESRDADAIKAFRQTVKLAPESADAWLRLAYLCEKEGKAEEALRAFKEAKRLWSF